MELTQQQRDTLKANALASPDTLAIITAGDLDALAAAYNAPAVPDFIVYKGALSRHSILTETSPTGTVFAWAGAAYITRNQGERDAFREMFNDSGTVNPAQPTMQAAFNDIFSGVGGAGNRAHITAMSKRKATRLEKLFATGAGTDAAPATLVVEGAISSQDLINL